MNLTLAIRAVDKGLLVELRRRRGVVSLGIGVSSVVIISVLSSIVKISRVLGAQQKRWRLWRD